MSEYMFGVSHQKPSRKVARQMERIAKRHGAYLVEGTFPGEGYKRWFAGPNLGHPFDRAMAKAVYDDLVRAGIVIANERGESLLAPTAMAAR
jgi:hypothetical protein